ncbi:MAG: carbohydrate-binding protein [bacterium]|nr:carbohydrate-binding protein [bacterium]
MTVKDWVGRTKAVIQKDDIAVLSFEDVYEIGDTITIHVPEVNQYYIVRIDDTLDEALVYMTKEEVEFEIPFGEKKKSYNKKAFTGERHYLTCRKANVYEIGIYRNLAKNVMDQHGERGCYPHASANVETRGESVFAARNAIDGIIANHSHGSWPYESWGINKQEDAELLLEFGRPVEFDNIVLWTRADFPHDNWWTSAVLWFSDGTMEPLTMEKTDTAHSFTIHKKNITWIRLGNLKKSEDPSPFPALTQIEVYGREL